MSASPQPVLATRSVGRFGWHLRFLAVNACTVASLILGTSAIMLSMAQMTRIAALCVLGSVIFDGLDGTLARRLDVASPFGAQMDSLADLCAFGVATPVLAYCWLRDELPVFAIAPACALVVVSAAIRLARFNVSPKDANYFSGMPTTMAAAIFAVCALIDPGLAVLPLALLVVLALLMVSTLPYAKFGELRRRLPLWSVLVAAVLALISPVMTAALVTCAYLASGPLVWFVHHRRALPKHSHG